MLWAWLANITLMEPISLCPRNNTIKYSCVDWSFVVLEHQRLCAAYGLKSVIGQTYDALQNMEIYCQKLFNFYYHILFFNTYA